MRSLAFLALLATLSACAPRTTTTTTTTTTTATGTPAIRTLMHGLWSGTAHKSPLGKQPYAIEFRTEEGNLVGETPQSLGDEILPPGAYQLFHFGKASAPTERVTYKTAMGETGVLEGELQLDKTRSTSSHAIFCEPNNCESMEIHWEAVTTEKMNFQVWMDGRIHVDMVLAFDGDL